MTDVRTVTVPRPAGVPSYATGRLVDAVTGETLTYSNFPAAERRQENAWRMRWATRRAVRLERFEVAA